MATCFPVNETENFMVKISDMKLYYFDKTTLRYIPAIGFAALSGIIILLSAGSYLIGRSSTEHNVTFTDTTMVTCKVMDTIPGIIEVSGTYYNIDEKSMTADGSKISESDITSDGIRWVALSRDLIKRWGGPFDYGDTIYVWHPNNLLKGRWVVHDAMNARFKRKMDFMIHELEAENFPGLTENILISKQPIIPWP